MSPKTEPLFLGFDLSTQQLKAIVIDTSAAIVHESAVHFDTELPQYGTLNGALHLDGGQVQVPVGLWLDAIDMVFQKMKAADLNFAGIKAVGGSAQQHGSVWLGSDAENQLRQLDPLSPLSSQLWPGAFSLPNSPIWQDSSTAEECKLLQDAIGGAEALANLTGSRAYERFTGPQIMKVAKANPGIYTSTAALCLISSFLSTIFTVAGETDSVCFPAPIECADASGMNMMNILSHSWDNELLNICGGSADVLRIKLGGAEPVFGGTSLGHIGLWWQKRWGFSTDCVIAPFTGDNPATIAALAPAPGSALLSLGTSTTFLLSVPPSDSPPVRTTSSHLLAHPTSTTSGIIMLCYKNGALTRENIRDQYSARSWDEYNRMVKSIKPGSDGFLGLYFPLKEIIPPNVQGNFLFKYDLESASASPAQSIPDEYHPRLVLESQLLSIKSRILSILPSESPPLASLVVTGGSSKNPVIQQAIADILNMAVYIAPEESSKEAAALGGALLAKWVWLRQTSQRSNLTYEDAAIVVAHSSGAPVLVAQPKAEIAAVYDHLVDVYRLCEGQVIAGSSAS